MCCKLPWMKSAKSMNVWNVQMFWSPPLHFSEHYTMPFLWNVYVMLRWNTLQYIVTLACLKWKRTSCWETGLWFSCVFILTCMCVQSFWQHSRNAIWLQVKIFKPNCSIKQLESTLWSESNSPVVFQTPLAPHILFIGLNVAEKYIVRVLKWRVVAWKKNGEMQKNNNNNYNYSFDV